MQGFNKYYPPDYDPAKHSSLNAYRGKHALGDRARKLDQGILITRFELPFHIWCGSCESIIAMGNRFNAEKKKIGNYYTTPIFSFKCKCPTCGNYFEIETDPKNSQYVVASGARKKIEDWDPEENGGFAIHDPDAKEKTGADDPFAALEKSTDAKNHMNKVEIPRLEALQSVADHYASDPYSLSRKVRKRFREEKKVEKVLQAQDDHLKGRYGLPEELKLARDTDETREHDKQEWLKARQELALRDDAKRRKLNPVSIPTRSISGASSSSQGGSSAANLLRAKLLGSAGRPKPSNVGRTKSR